MAEFVGNIPDGSGKRGNFVIQQSLPEKKCCKCGEVKSLAQYYKHPSMADGHSGKCKECTKVDVKSNRLARLEQYAGYERMRLNRPERQEQIKRCAQNRKQNRPLRVRATYLTSNAIRDGRLVRQPCEVCGTTENVQAHHDDYSKPLDVRWLCFVHHRQVHGQLKYLKQRSA